MKEDVEALKTEHKRTINEMAEKQNTEIKRIIDEMAEKQKTEINDIKAEMKKLTQANDLKCKFVFQLISFHPTLNDYFFPVLVK